MDIDDCDDDIFERMILLTKPFETLLEHYGLVKSIIIERKNEMFPKNTLVEVNSPRYHGKGIVSEHQHGCSADNLAVKLDNGNTWYYPVNCCKSVK